MKFNFLCDLILSHFFPINYHSFHLYIFDFIDLAADLCIPFARVPPAVPVLSATAPRFKNHCMRLQRGRPAAATVGAPLHQRRTLFAVQGFEEAGSQAGKKMDICTY